jgi:FKBP-type peptidyl-prolyl cis-trans isomerase
LNTKTVLIACSVVAGCLLSGCSSSKSTPTGGSSSSSAQTASNGASSAGSTGAMGASVTFQGVTVTGADNLKAKPTVTAKSSQQPATLEVKDLVVGTGAAASPTSTVNVQYVGVLYTDGKQFDASWDHGGPTSFPLTQVVPGFTQGIGGTSTIPPMKVGGRRLMILPPALGYGAQGTPDGSIPPNTPIVFVVDLLGVQR